MDTMVTNISTNLCLVEKNGFFTSIMSSLTHNVTLQSSHLTDLVLLCSGPDGLLPVSVHSAVLCSQSPLLKDLLLSVTEPVLVLPEVELDTVWYMLDLVYTGRCVVTKQKDSSKLIHLLSNLGMATIVEKLKMETLNEDHSPQECIDHSMSERMSSSGSIKFKPTPPSPELYCKECGIKFQVKQAIELFFHERDCKINTAMARHRSVENLSFKDAQTQIPMPLSSPNFSPQSQMESSYGQGMEIYKEFLESKKTDPTSGDHLDCTQLEVSASMSLTSSTQKRQKVSKKCYICGTVIAGAGKYWIRPLYSHFSRRHFAEELLRDFGTPDKKCSMCGKEEETQSQFVGHLGSHHRLVEKYLDLNKLQGQETNSDSPPSIVIKGEYIKHDIKSKQIKPRRLQLEVTQLAKSLLDQAGPETLIPEPKHEKSNNHRFLTKSKSEAKISCPFCEKKVVMRPVLQSHLASKHFKKDCEEGIKQILEKSGGICPKCPGFNWSKPGTKDWSVLLHFSRKHKIAQDLEYSDNLLNQENVEKILQKFCSE